MKTLLVRANTLLTPKKTKIGWTKTLLTPKKMKLVQKKTKPKQTETLLDLIKTLLVR